MSADGSGPRAVAPALDRSIDQIEWSADGRALLAPMTKPARSRVARIGLDGSVRPIVRDAANPGFDRPYAGGGFSAARTGAIAYTAGSVDRPTDVAVAGANGAARPLTRLNALTLGAKRLATLRHIRRHRPRRRHGAVVAAAPADISAGHSGCR